MIMKKFMEEFETLTGGTTKRNYSATEAATFIRDLLEKSGAKLDKVTLDKV